MDILIESLSHTDPNIITVSIEALQRIFEGGDKGKADNNLQKNPFLEIFMQKNGLEKIQDLQMHESNKVYTKTSDLIEQFFEVEDPLEGIM